MNDGASPSGTSDPISRTPTWAHGLRRPPFFRSVLGTFGTNVAVAALSLLNVLIMARALGPTGRGEFAFLNTIAGVPALLATLGINQANANFGAERPQDTPALAGTTAVLSLVLGAVAIAMIGCLFALVPSARGDVPTALRWAALATIPLLILQWSLRELVMAQYHFALSNIAWLLAPVINVVANGLLAALGLITVSTALVAWILGQGLITIVLAGDLAVRLGGLRRPRLALARRMLGFGLKAHIGRSMQVGNYRLDQWIVGSVSGSRELGIYSVAVAWAEALFFLPTAVSMVQRPDLVRAGRAEAASQASKVFRGATAITLVFAGAMILLAPLLCETVFGASFRGSIPELRLLCLGSFGVVAMKILGNALTAQRKPMLETAAIGMGFVLTVALDVLLIPAHRGIGAATASAIAYTAGGVAAALILCRALDSRLAHLLPRLGELSWIWAEARRALRRP
jgi:O-antigen/teichoic acid export membrane protein